MPVKIDPDIVEELAAMDLVIWEAKHPKVSVFNEKTGKNSDREDKSWVIATLAGPGSNAQGIGSGPTLRAAVDTALKRDFPDRIKGLKGAVLRLDEALLRLDTAVRWKRYREEAGYEGDPDDFIPF